MFFPFARGGSASLYFLRGTQFDLKVTPVSEQRKVNSSCPSPKAIEVLWLFGQEQGRSTTAGKKGKK